MKSTNKKACSKKVALWNNQKATINTFMGTLYHGCFIKSIWEKMEGKMEQLKSVLHDVMICHDSNEMKKGHDISHDISLSNKEMISKNDYHYLVQVLEGWRVFYPKAQIKKYGAKNCWIAMQRVKSSNARTPGAYFTITVRNLIKENNEKHFKSDLKPLKNETGIITPKNDFNPVKNDCGLPKIENWMQARQFICDVYEGKIKQNDNVIELMNQVKRKYNFA